jgi:hypothetical protein
MNTLGKDVVWYDGLRFIKEPNGYYNHSAYKRRWLVLHRYIYEKQYGKIKDGYEVHHIDLDKNNNNIENLVVMSYSEHRSLHNKTKKFLEQRIETNKRPDVIDKIQAKHAEIRKEKNIIANCKTCGKEFLISKMDVNRRKYCSKLCYPRR